MYPLTEQAGHVRVEVEMNQWLGAAPLRQLQLDRLNALLEHAVECVPFHRKRLATHTGRAPRLRSLDELVSLPTLTKSDIQSNLDAMLAAGVSRDGWIKNATGGSTGEPLVFYRDSRAQVWVDAAKERFRRWMGAVDEDKLALIWGADRDVPTQFPPNEKWLNVFGCREDDIEPFIRDLVKWQPRTIRGYASSLHLVAQFIQGRRLPAVRPHAIEATAETLTPEMRRDIEAAFGAPVFNLYGSREVSCIACEDGGHDGLRVADDIRLVEIIHAGRPACPGEDGAIVVTDLVNYAMPLIRYEIGDVGTAPDARAADARETECHFSSIAHVQGRTASTITAPDGRLIHGEFFTHLFYQKPGVRMFQVRQALSGALDITVVPTADFRPEIMEGITAVVRDHFGTSVSVGWRTAPDIPASPTGKRMFTVSEIPVRFTEATRTRKPRVLFLADRPEWAFDINAHGLAEVLKDEFEVRIEYVVEQPDLRVWNYDLLVVMFWGETYHRRFSPDPRKVIKQVASHRWALEEKFGRLQPEEMAERYLDDAATVIVPSERMRKIFAPLRRRVFRTPVGIVPSQFKPSTHADGPLRVGWAGNLKDGCKGLEDILRPAAGQDFELRIAGGDLPVSEMAAFYNSIDVILVASTAEGNPRPLIEGMACGCFPVAVDVGIVPELVEHRVNGLIVERSVAAFREALEWCRANVDLVRRSGDSNAARIREHRAWTAVAPFWRDAFRAALREIDTDSARPSVRAIGGGRPRVLLIADVPNWIFARHCRALVDRLSDEFELTVICANEPFDEDAFDLIYPLEWNLVVPERIRRPGKYLTGIRSHSSWNTHDFEQFTAFLRAGFQRVHVVSRRLQRLLEPFVPGLVHLSHGVDTHFFTPDEKPGRAVPRGERPLRVGWAGNRKAIDKGVEIIEPLGNLPGIELVTCGYGQRHLTQHEMREFYASLDLYACASRQEGHNNALMEAAAMELAIVTTDNGTVPEYLQHGVSALIVEREYPAFVAACQELAGDPERRRALGKAARQAVVEHFDWNLIAEGYRELFRSAVKDAPTAQPLTVALRHPARTVEAASQPAAHLSSTDHAAAAASAKAVASAKDELRRAALLNDAARLIVPAIVSRRIEEIVIYGAGEAGRALAEACGWHGVRVSAFVDRDPAKIGTTIGAVDVMSLDEAVRRGVTAFAIGSFAFTAEIRRTIEAAYAREGRHPVIFDGEPPANRRVSVIVCTHGDRFQSFELLVTVLERQSIDFELVVVVGQASDNLRRVVAALADRARIVECPEPNVSRARNIGIRAAGGDIVVFIDDDALPADREWLARLTAPLRLSGERIAGAGGAVIAGYTGHVDFNRGVTSRAGFQRYRPSGDEEAPPPDGSEWLTGVPGGNCAFLTSVLREVGGFDQQYAYYLDETDVCARLLTSGYRIVQVDDAAILHYPGPSVHGPAHLRSRRLIARSDAYFVMRHTAGSKMRRAWRAVKFLPAKDYVIDTVNRRKARLLTRTALIKFQAQFAIGLAAGIWAGGRTADGTMENTLAPAPAWRLFPRNVSRPRAAVAVSVCSSRVADWKTAMTVATALSRGGYEVSLLAGGDPTVSTPREAPLPPGFEDAVDVWQAASVAVRLFRPEQDARLAASTTEVVVGGDLVARLRTEFAPHVLHIPAERSPELASSSLGRWLLSDNVPDRVPVRITVGEAVEAVDRLMTRDAYPLGGAEAAPRDAMTLIARVWLARLRDDLEREPATTPWPLRMARTWTTALALVRHCLIGQQPQLALELAAIYATHVRDADPPMAAELDYHGARALRLLHRDSEAWPLYELVLDAARTGYVGGPIHAGACYHLATAAEARGLAEKARDLLTECVRVQPDHGAAQRLLEQLRQREASAA
jgi:phenylacetate-coenzyme A ligase PaaK-like adenylate-forming protein/glycosyltransferase involved in cell wall biosynthesis/GT2 family glycosyltransferase